MEIRPRGMVRQRWKLSQGAWSDKAGDYSKGRGQTKKQRLGQGAWSDKETEVRARGMVRQRKEDWGKKHGQTKKYRLGPGAWSDKNGDLGKWNGQTKK